MFMGIVFRPPGAVLTGLSVSGFQGGFWPVLNQGERAILFCFIYLVLATAGPGKLALDNLLFRRSAEADKD